MIPDRRGLDRWELERWERVEELFRTALALDPERRSAWLDEIAGEDEGIHAEVASLLAADAQAGDRLERLVREGVGLVSRTAFGVGSTIEGYVLEREIGRGGSSTVYLGVARRGGGRDRRAERVAVKVLRSEVRSSLARRRFLLEGKILAGLEHPGIARLLSAGTLLDGRPYFRMELVEGEPLTDYCRRRRLSLPARLRLFRAVCEAVQYAHRNLVVHQDLKPANLLVTADGRPKLLDFGIARLMQAEPAASGVDRIEADPATADLTVTAPRRLTPSYASPEQIRGEPLTTATDVFSLGVVLYELLTDRHPFRREDQGALGLEQAILHQDPTPPSVVLRRRGSHRQGLRVRRVGSDLDRVVAMALDKERERRYGSVDQLSGDLRRFLEGRPVAARRSTAAYRARKFLARHWMTAAVATAALVLLAAFAVVTAVQQRRTSRAWAEADQERRKAEQALSFLVDTFELAGPDRARGETVTTREILDHGAERVERELSGQPRVQATLLEAMGRVYFQLGLYDRARPLLEKALALLRPAEGTDPGSPGPDPVELGRTLRTLGDVLQTVGDYTAAETVYREALEVRKRHFGDRHPAVAESLNDLGDVLHDRGDYAAAEPLYRQALALRRELLGERHPDVAESLNNLALLFHERQQLDRAEPLYRQALALRRELLGPDHPDIATSLANLAALLHARGKLDEAEDLFRQAVTMNERLHDGPQTAAALQNLALLLKDRGELDEAEALLHRVLDLELGQLGETHPNRATNLYHLGLVKREEGDVAAAESYFRQAEDLYRRTLPADHPWISYPLLARGEGYLKQNRPREARPLLVESVRLRRAALGEDNPLTALAESALGDCLAALAQGEGGAEGTPRTAPGSEAERLLRSSWHTLEAAYGPDDRRTVWARERVERWLPG